MITQVKSISTAVRFATVLVLFAAFTSSAGSAWAQNGKSRSPAGGGKQAVSNSGKNSGFPKVNRTDATLRIGKTLSSGPAPLPKVNRDDIHRRRAQLQNFPVIAFQNGAAGDPGTTANTPDNGNQEILRGTWSQPSNGEPVYSRRFNFGVPNNSALGVSAGDFNQDGTPIVNFNFRINGTKLHNPASAGQSQETRRNLGMGSSGLPPIGSRSFSGQDQETGEFITFSKLLNSKRDK